jgi:hypothetical protein
LGVSFKAAMRVGAPGAGARDREPPRRDERCCATGGERESIDVFEDTLKR